MPKLVRKWSDPVRHERIIARIVECILATNLASAKQWYRSRSRLSKAMSRRLLESMHYQGADKELLEFFGGLTLHPVTEKTLARLWPRMHKPGDGVPHSTLADAWASATYRQHYVSVNPGPRSDPLHFVLRVVGPDDTRFQNIRSAFVTMSENAAMYDHLTKLPDVARTPRPRKPKQTLVQTRAAKAEEAAKLWRRRLRVAKAKLEKYTKAQKYYAKKEAKA